MDFIVELLISALLIFAGIFGLIGSIGLIKLDDIMRRLHAPTKATTLGVGGILIGAMLYSAAYLNSVSLHELLITLFLFLTAPISANFIAKSHMHRKVKEEDLPPTEGEFGWSVYDEAPDEMRPIDTH